MTGILWVSKTSDMVRHPDVISQWKTSFFDITKFFSNLELLVALKIPKLIPCYYCYYCKLGIWSKWSNKAHDWYLDIPGGGGGSLALIFTGAAAQILNLENRPLKKHEKYTLTYFFQNTISLQILTKIFLSFSLLVPKELRIQVPCHRTCKKTENFCAISSWIYFDIKSTFKSFSEMIIWQTFYKKSYLRSLFL